MVVSLSWISGYGCTGIFIRVVGSVNLIHRLHLHTLRRFRASIADVSSVPIIVRSCDYFQSRVQFDNFNAGLIFRSGCYSGSTG